MSWVRFRRLCLALLVAIIVVNNLGGTYAVIVGLNSVRDSGYYECNVDRKLDLHVIRALEVEKSRFLSGTWFNGKVEMFFAGDSDALNHQIFGLSECPAKRVTVSFQAFKRNGMCSIDCARTYWKVNHDPHTGIFAFTIDKNSTTLQPEDFPVPLPDRPPMEE
jgi:hypothetical protein